MKFIICCAAFWADVVVPVVFGVGFVAVVAFAGGGFVPHFGCYGLSFVLCMSWVSWCSRVWGVQVVL